MISSCSRVKLDNLFILFFNRYHYKSSKIHFLQGAELIIPNYYNYYYYLINYNVNQEILTENKITQLSVYSSGVLLCRDV